MWYEWIIQTNLPKNAAIVPFYMGNTDKCAHHLGMNPGHNKFQQNIRYGPDEKTQVFRTEMSQKRTKRMQRIWTPQEL